MINISKDNIIVREFTKDDFPQFITELCHNDSWTNIFQMWAVDDDNAVQLFAHHLEEYKEYNIKDLGLMLGVFTKSGSLIGECGFEYNTDLKSIEVFLGLVESARGKRYGHEIVSALEDVSKELEIKVVNANVPEAHIIVTKIFDKSNFEFVKDYDLVVNDELTMKMRHYVLK